MWGQHFTEAAWAGVLGALRAAPASILGGPAGRVAGVPALLEAYVNLVAVQVRKDKKRKERARISKGHASTSRRCVKSVCGVGEVMGPRAARTAGFMCGGLLWKNAVEVKLLVSSVS